MTTDKTGKALPKGISLRADGRYVGRIKYMGESHSVYGSTVKEAKKKLDDLKYELEHGLFAKESEITLNAWFETWLKEYKQAFKNQLINRNPVPLATLPKFPEHKERRVLTLEEQNLFLRYAIEGKSKYNYVYELALSTGMRSGEMCGLEWSDLDFNNRIIHVRGTLVQNRYGFYKDLLKTHSSLRDIPMLDNVFNLLKERRKAQIEQRLLLGAHWEPLKDLENLVVTTDTGRPLGKSYLNKDIVKIINRIQLTDEDFQPLTVHTFRHTFATRCIENGMEPQVLKTILGHSKLSMTMDLYAHVLPNTKVQEMQKIANLF